MSCAHWSDRYLGLPYRRGTNDCAALAARVVREQFGRALHLPCERPPGARLRGEQIASLRGDYGVPTDDPRDGDAVLMRCGAGWHLGIYCELAGEPHVLHALARGRQVSRHRLRDLARLGLEVEGFYRWR